MIALGSTHRPSAIFLNAVGENQQHNHSLLGLLGVTLGPRRAIQTVSCLGTFGPKSRVHSGTFGYIRVHSGTFGRAGATVEAHESPQKPMFCRRSGFRVGYILRMHPSLL